MKHGSLGGNPAARLAGKPEIIRSLSLHQSKVRNLLDLGLRFESCTQDDLLRSAFDLQKRFGLLTNDSVVLAVAVRLEADGLVSSDKGFRSVDEVSESIARGAGCSNGARPDLWEPRAGNRPRPPGDSRFRGNGGPSRSLLLV